MFRFTLPSVGLLCRHFGWEYAFYVPSALAAGHSVLWLLTSSPSPMTNRWASAISYDDEEAKGTLGPGEALLNDETDEGGAEYNTQGVNLNCEYYTSGTQATAKGGKWEDWKVILGSIAVWAIVIQTFVCAFTFYLMLTWLPTYELEN